MRIEHLAVYTENIERLADFYQTYFGAEKSGLYSNESGFSSRFVTFDDGARLEIMSHKRLEITQHRELENGYVHLALSVGSREAVDALTGRICADGYPLLSSPRETGDGYYESCVADCDGNRVEITL